ncbi:MAG: single-stranded-DNA-specific exonuclease RecJ [Verrucomicrobia subdivision 3 bacterium]|nr:single-stranded-DNA-specific exonuclease RecJ [Limisphaerales bacterium]
MQAQSKYRWTVAPAQPVLAQHLAARLGVSQLLAQCLLNRGHSEPESIVRFLEPRLKHLADPFLLPNIAPAVDRLFAARERREPLVIFGDYDVDGVTATALLVEALRRLGWDVDYYLPHRMEEGYGLSRVAVENCLKRFERKLLLAVDCGSTAVETIAFLQGRGIVVIVLDHHQVCDPGPAAVAIVNPQLAPEGAPSFRELCSVGLAFKLVHAVLKRGREMGQQAFFEFDLKPFLDLVALGTIADIVPLCGENRILVSRGLYELNHTARPGLVALRDVAKIGGRIGGYEVGFQLAPRLNAAGRLETALEALQLLLTRDAGEARHLAKQLDAHNRERQEIEKRMAKEVVARIRSRFEASRDFVIVEGDLSWHIGVVGIVASRVLQEFHRPTIIFGGDGEQWRGSGRSIDGFDLAAALRECSELLLRHGGHAMAAGLAILPDNLESFRVRLNDVACKLLHPEQLRLSLRLDAQVACGELTADRVRELERLQQTGIGNPPVHLCALGVTHARPLYRFGADKKHVRITITDGTAMHDVIWWNGGNGNLPVGQFDIAFVPQLSQFNGESVVRLKFLDWRSASPKEA